jgi:hypothetical protein
MVLCYLPLCKSIAVKPELKVTSNSPSCFGKTDGTIIIDLVGYNSGKFQIAVMDSTSKQLLGFDNGTKIPYELKNLKEGAFTILYSWEGKTEKREVRIVSPETLKANIITIKELKGRGTSVTATLQANPSGGNPPYSIIWSNNTGKQTGYITKELPQGIYTCTIDDTKHCGPVTATFFLYEDEIKKYNEKAKHN